MAERRKENVVFSVCLRWLVAAGWSERAVNRFVMVRQSPRLLKDVNDAEEAELRRLEGRVDDVPFSHRCD